MQSEVFPQKDVTPVKRLREFDASEWRTAEWFGHYQNVLTDIVEMPSRQVDEYVKQ